jgi:hypothetical protein
MRAAHIPSKPDIAFKAFKRQLLIVTTIADLLERFSNGIKVLSIFFNHRFQVRQAPGGQINFLYHIVMRSQVVLVSAIWFFKNSTVSTKLHAVAAITKSMGLKLSRIQNIWPGWSSDLSQYEIHDKPDSET